MANLFDAPSAGASADGSSPTPDAPAATTAAAAAAGPRAHPCTGCGRYHFPQLTRCYWCRADGPDRASLAPPNPTKVT